MPRGKRRIDWTPEEVAVIRRGAEAGLNAVQILESNPAVLKRRTIRAVRQKLSRDPGVRTASHWSHPEMVALRKAFGLGEERLREKFPELKDRTMTAIREKARRLGLEPRVDDDVHRCVICGRKIAKHMDVYCSSRCRLEGDRRDLGSRYCLGCNEELEPLEGEPWRAYRNRLRCEDCGGTT